MKNKLFKLKRDKKYWDYDSSGSNYIYDGGWGLFKERNINNILFGIIFRKFSNNL